MSDGEYFTCSYGCAVTTGSQCVGIIRDLNNDELGKVLRLLQKQSEDKKEQNDEV